MRIRRGQKISAEFLRSAHEAATVPVKNIGPYTLKVFAAVGDLKAAQQLRKPDKRGWDKLRGMLDDAVAAGDFSAFDDFAKAWKSLDVEAANLRLGGEDFPCCIGFKNKPKARVTKAIVHAIDCLQETLDRAPCRQEILEFMSSSEAMGEPVDIDDAELCTQLRNLGIQDMIPLASELGS